ncbi:MAG: hypothetical protein NC548_10840 [Lachnospiraceae bacterium]|nr:hypothetical protein [Lachnospiraceae bacterium]
MMEIYNPDFFNRVSPKFLRVADSLLREIFHDCHMLYYSDIMSFGAGSMPAVMYVNTDYARTRELSKVLKRWSALSGMTSRVVLGKTPKAAPVFLSLDEEELFT